MSTNNKDFIKLIDSLEEDFRSKHPEVKEEDVCIDITVVYSFGGYETGCKTDFTLEIYEKSNVGCFRQGNHEHLR